MFLFKSKAFDPTQFENELMKITFKITSNEKKLRNLKSQKKYYGRLIPIYLTSGYVIYFSYLYKMGKIFESMNMFYLILIPVIFGLIYYSFLTFYNYLINNKESYIEYLKEQHSEKLSTLKEKTNFNKTKDLLARFSDGEDLKQLEKEANEIQQKKAEYLKMIQSGDKNKIIEDLKHQSNNNTGFYDMLMTSLLGENELSPDKRYALICSNCFQHNGLAAPGKSAKEIKYVCPKCGFMNNNDEKVEEMENNDDNKENIKEDIKENKDESNSK